MLPFLQDSRLHCNQYLLIWWRQLLSMSKRFFEIMIQVKRKGSQILVFFSHANVFRCIEFRFQTKCLLLNITILFCFRNVKYKQKKFFSIFHQPSLVQITLKFVYKKSEKYWKILCNEDIFFLTLYVFTVW